VLSPLTQLVLIYPEANWGRLSREMKRDWIDQTNWLLLEESVVRDRTRNPEILAAGQAFFESGVPRGRSHPSSDTGLGPEVVVDGLVEQLAGETTNRFWSFSARHFPVELIIENSDARDAVEAGEQPETMIYNWVCVVPRAEWQIAFSVDILVSRLEWDEGWVPDQVVPIHYQGKRPVVYHFSQTEGVGVRVIIVDAKVAKNNSWWAPIYEIGAGWEEIQ